MEEQLEKILSIFKIYGKNGLTVQDICRRVEFERETLSKYLNILLAMGEVSYRVVDDVKIWEIKSDLANINVEVVHSHGTDEIYLAQDISSKIKKKIQSPKLVLIFLSVDINLQPFLTYLKGKFGKKTKISGCTTVGEFSNLDFDGDGIVALAFDSDHIDIGVGIGENLSSGGFNVGKIASKNAYQNLDLNVEMFKKMPSSIATLLNNNNSFTLMFSDYVSGEEEEVINGIRDTFSRNCDIFGASSGNNLNLKENFQFVGDKIYTDSVLLILVVTDAKVVFGSNHGWKHSSSRGAFVTKSSGRIVQELNNERAVDVYARNLGLDSKNLVKEKNIAFSVGNKCTLGAPDNMGEYWLKQPIEVLMDGSIKFFANVPTGVALNFMTGNPQSLLQATKKLIDDVKKKVPEPAFALIFNCVARKNLLGLEGCHKEFEIIKEELECPFIGFYSMGEQGSNGYGIVGHRTQSINVCLVSKKILK